MINFYVINKININKNNLSKKKSDLFVLHESNVNYCKQRLRRLTESFVYFMFLLAVHNLHDLVTTNSPGLTTDTHK